MGVGQRLPASRRDLGNVARLAFFLEGSRVGLHFGSDQRALLAEVAELCSASVRLYDRIDSTFTYVCSQGPLGRVGVALLVGALLALAFAVLAIVASLGVISILQKLWIDVAIARIEDALRDVLRGSGDLVEGASKDARVERGISAEYGLGVVVVGVHGAVDAAGQVEIGRGELCRIALLDQNEQCCLMVRETYRVACAYELVDVDGDVARFLRAAVDRCVGHCDIFHCVSVLSSMKEGGRRA